jgi:hypothetical protein
LEELNSGFDFGLSFHYHSGGHEQRRFFRNENIAIYGNSKPFSEYQATVGAMTPLN